jgi:hypothetical protein
MCPTRGKRPTLGDVGIATRANGTAPPDVPLSDVNLGSWEFWGLDDDVRDGAFASLRREATRTALGTGR